ncbi:hypothetical protein GGI25_006215 [Coemansia spiralis]|uniref:EVE domain-containing protein n=2 Tax=Coemansia TaxID=4863 RepID=A0A9W8G305_9FUNG|nr:PUA-like domain-containing protein [Coemansia spiralis]KAJ1987494.1 hypothetical protein EDC05_005808 [Coemansia umbellata]KAJ2619088.1 hypothetical protein GGI26_006115 [Coemansia sp. RSA 1358]KAJ2669218.1 hypothetical protein GGI25_006215 [Coemansia spiralis]
MPPLRRSTRLQHHSYANPVQYWLMKAEPDSRIVKGIDVKFSIDDLCNMKGSTSPWDGVRNFEARNIMRDKMNVGDKVLFYHSNCKTPGVAGTAVVVRSGYPDHTAFDKAHPYYDPKSSPDSPKWYMVDIKFESKFPKVVTLNQLKQHEDLKEMVLIKRGRLSVQPVRKNEYEFILDLAK